MVEPTYDKGYSNAPGFQGIKAQSRLDYRYFHEDIGYGLVFLQSLAEQIGVETPCISAIIRLASVLMEQDYLTQGKRTMKTLGLSGYTARELERLLT
ncbi:MAG: NAD/NADP octopine/nopaline dehydrogenase family protein [Candidatus Heimdallarchaeota archaeon]